MYSPQFSETATITVRRLAWALGIKMTKAVELIIKEIPHIYSPTIVCPHCLDNTKCKQCEFHHHIMQDVQALSS